MIIFFDFIINFFEAILLFLTIHLLTWKITKIEILNSPFYKLKTIISLLVFISFNNTWQILCNIFWDMPSSKILGLIVFIICASLIFSITYNNIKKIYYYIFASLYSILILLVAETIVIGIASMFHIDINSVLGLYYIEMCIFSIIIKYGLLVLTICILEPTFFSKFIKKQKDISANLLASTVMMTAKTTSLGASWFWFYNPKTPKGLNKDKSSKINK